MQAGWRGGARQLGERGVGRAANHQGCHSHAQLRAAPRAPTRNVLPGPPAGPLSEGVGPLEEKGSLSSGAQTDQPATYGVAYIP